MLNQHRDPESAPGSSRPTPEKLKASPPPLTPGYLSRLLTNPQKRRDQNRISQRAFRRRKEQYTSALEARVLGLEALLDSAGRENSFAASRLRSLEAELAYYRDLLGSPGELAGALPAGGDSRTQFGTAGLNAAPYPYSPAMSTLAVPVLGDEYQRAGSYGSSAGAYSPQLSERSVSDPRMSPMERNLDSAAWAYPYLQFDTGEPRTTGR